MTPDEAVGCVCWGVSAQRSSASCISYLAVEAKLVGSQLKWILWAVLGLAEDPFVAFWKCLNPRVTSPSLCILMTITQGCHSAAHKEWLLLRVYTLSVEVCFQVDKCHIQIAC